MSPDPSPSLVQALPLQGIQGAQLNSMKQETLLSSVFYMFSALY